MRMIQIQDNISEQKNLKDKLESEQEKLHVEYSKVKIQWYCNPHHSIIIYSEVGRTDLVKSAALRFGMCD